MKTKYWSVLLGCILVIVLLITACSSGTTSTTTSSTTQTTTTGKTSTTTSQTATTTATTSKASTTTGPGGQQYGGTMRWTNTQIPTIFGNPKEWNAGKVLGTAYLENMGTFDVQGNLVPQLATSWDVDPNAKTVVFHLRKGVKFHDGTDFDAAAAKWNFEYWISSGKLSGGNYITSMDVVDQYTLRLNLSQYSALNLPNYVQYPFFFSPTYIQKVGWEASRQNPIGTGPFKFVAYQLNSYIKCTRNTSYWRQGQPYMDGVDLSLMIDPTAASMMLQAGQVDLLWAMPSKTAVDMKAKGFGVKFQPSLYFSLVPNSADPADPMSNILVRQAIEYAIDRPAIAKAVGYGMMDPLDAFVPTTLKGAPDLMYPTNYTPRNFDVNKAKQLLAQAGYGAGFNTTLVIRDDATHRDVATAIQSYLSNVGINAKIDVSDNARFEGIHVGGLTFKGLYLSQTRVNPGIAFIAGVMQDWRPGGAYVNCVRSPEYTALYAQLAGAGDDDSVISLSQTLMKLASEEAMAIGVATFPQTAICSPKLHTTALDICSNPAWSIWEDWFEK
jgi:peptide/nickel transport system substrate-binding protein